MTATTFKVVVTDLLMSDSDHEELVTERAVLSALGVQLHKAEAVDEDSIIRAGEGAIGLIVTYAQITRRVLESLPDLKVVVKCGIGFDNLDTHAAEELGIYTVNVPDYGEQEVAAHTLGLVLDGIRAVGFGASQVKDGGWHLDLPALHLRRPSSLTVGVVGMGRIAKKFLSYVAPLTDNLRFFDPFVSSYDGAESCETVQELFASSDVVSLHLPLNDGTRGLISRDVLNAARRGLVLVNTSRAGLIERSSLVEAIERGVVAYFGSDVGWEEPLDLSDRENTGILLHPRTSITPHIAWYSEDSDRELRHKASMEVARVIRGERPLNVVRHPVSKA